MRYIVVNTRAVREDSEKTWCTYCTTDIGKTYVRCLETRCVYHSHFCLEMHINDTTLCIEDAARRTS